MRANAKWALEEYVVIAIFAYTKSLFVLTVCAVAAWTSIEGRHRAQPAFPRHRRCQ